MATKKSMKILQIMLMMIGLATLMTLPAFAAPKWPIPEGIKTIEVNGYDMAYQEIGRGVPLVLVHGMLVDYRVWSLQVPDFSKAYRTISVSLRHSYPEKWNGVGNDFSIPQHASDVAALIKNLNIGKVHLFGHSRGGAVVLNLARLYPEVIRTLILEDGLGMESLLPADPESQKSAAEATERRRMLRVNISAGDMEKAAREFQDALGGRGYWEKIPAERKQMILDNIRPAMVDEKWPEIRCADIQKFSFPVLLLTGERSPKFYGQTYSAMRQCKSDILAPVIIPRGTHNMHRDNPEFFNKAVLDFLNQH